MSRTVWSNAALGSEAEAQLADAVAPETLVWAAQRTGNLAAGASSDSLAAAEIAFGQPDPTAVLDAPGLKWVALTSAGYTRYDTPELREAFASRGVVLTNSSSVYNDPCAQHLLAFMLAEARGLHAAFAAQQDRDWRYRELRQPSRVLRGDTVLMVGYGAIAQRLTELLAPFELNLLGFRRQPRGDELIDVRPFDELDAMLPHADHVVSTLPGHPSTDGFFSADRIARLAPGARFYNVGRGTTVDQVALIATLEAGRIKAYLDVTDPEPLPADHPLWKAPNCTITPHIAGGMQDEPVELVRHFATNLLRYREGRTLLDRVF